MLHERRALSPASKLIQELRARRRYSPWTEGSSLSALRSVRDIPRLNLTDDEAEGVMDTYTTATPSDPIVTPLATSTSSSVTMRAALAATRRQSKIEFGTKKTSSRQLKRKSSLSASQPGSAAAAQDFLNHQRRKVLTLTLALY